MRKKRNFEFKRAGEQKRQISTIPKKPENLCVSKDVEKRLFFCFRICKEKNRLKDYTIKFMVESCDTSVKVASYYYDKFYKEYC